MAIFENFVNFWNFQNFSKFGDFWNRNTQFAARGHQYFTILLLTLFCLIGRSSHFQLSLKISLVITKPSIKNNQIWQIWIGKYVDSDTNFRSDFYVNTSQCYSWSRNIKFWNRYVISSVQMAMTTLNLKCLQQLYLQKDSRYFHTAS